MGSKTLFDSGLWDFRVIGKIERLLTMKEDVLATQGLKELFSMQ
jgi:hypothetical protein